MRIGLIDIEPKIFNTAYMQIAYHHKKLGDSVEWVKANDCLFYDKLYCSSLFGFTDKSDVPPGTICGGTGFDLTTKLPFDCHLDYSIYPECKTSYVWFTRGCIRNCPWCVVREKEGFLHPVARKPLNRNGRYITVMDNNLFANPLWKDAIAWIGRMPVDIQGIDVRTLDAEKCKALNGLKQWKRKQFHIAWDNPKEDLRPAIRAMLKHVKAYKIMCYVLIGFNSSPDQDLYRTEELRKLKIDPFVMPYDKHDRYQKDFARYVNAKQIWRDTKWEDYKR